MAFRRTLSIALAAAAAVSLARDARAEDVARANVMVNVSLASRTSLRVSSELLQFEVASNGTTVASVDFTAGMRMPAGSDVVLSIEPLTGLDGPGGAADVETALSFTGHGDGLLSGPVGAGQTVVGRWHGSGLREGRLLFTLRANAAGSYVLPVRFVLSTP